MDMIILDSKTVYFEENLISVDIGNKFKRFIESINEMNDL